MVIPDINQVFEWLDLKGEVIAAERVLYILPEAETLIVIRLPQRNEQKRAGRRRRDLPFQRSMQEYADALAAGTLQVAPRDPFEDASEFLAGVLRVEEVSGENVPDATAKNFKHYKRLQRNWLLGCDRRRGNYVLADR